MMKVTAGLAAFGLLIGLSAGAGTAEAQTDARLVEAVKLAQEGQGDTARARVRRLLDATAAGDTLYPQVLYTLGMITNDGAERQRLFQRVAVEFSTSSWADESLFRLAQVAYAANEYDAAARYLDRIRQDFPGSALLGYAALYGARARFQTNEVAAACRWVTEGLARPSLDTELQRALETERQRCAPSAIGAADSARAVPAADNTRAAQPATEPQRTVSAAAGYRVQIAAVGTQSAADEVMSVLREMRVDGIVVRDGGLYKVRAGPYATRAEAQSALAALRARFGGQPFVVAAQ